MLKQFSQILNCTEPKLLFGNNGSGIHPLQGLIDYGPFSKSNMLSQFPDSIRIAAILPAGSYASLSKLVKELNTTQYPKERKKYLKNFPGFKSLFGVPLELNALNGCIELNDNELFEASGNISHHALADKLGNAVRAMAARRLEYDVLFILLPERWSSGFSCKEENFDLHDFLKAQTATHSIPSQVVRESSALNYFCRCSVAWRMSIATYVKAGGIPWKLQEVNEDTAFIGLSYSVLFNEGTGKYDFITCCSQVFDADGTGLEFIAYETDEIAHQRGDNPFLSRSEMRKVMARSISLYQRRHCGRIPKRVIVHKTTHFTKDEVDGCFDAFHSDTKVDLLQVVQQVDWRGVNVYSKGNIGGYPVKRGSVVQLDHDQILLWTQGVVGLNGPFYKEGKGIPEPLRIVRHAGDGNWLDNAQAILGLTKMDWNHDGLYKRLPITLGYASTLATTIKRMGSLQNRPYEFRFFM